MKCLMPIRLVTSILVLLGVWGIDVASGQTTTFADRSDALLDYLNTTSPNVGQTNYGPHRIGRTGFWYGQGRLERGNTSTGLSYISAAVGDADAPDNSGFSLWPGMDTWYRHNAIFPQTLKDKYRDEYVGALHYGGSTPNQRLMSATGCYLASEIWGAEAVTSNSNAANGYGDPTGKAFINHLLDNLPRYNCEEHNSGQYLTFNLGPFHTLANFAPDPQLRQKARMGFDWLLADTAPSWLNGYACISNTRGRVDAPQNSYGGTTNLGWWLQFGGPTPASLFDSELHAQYALPDYPGVPAEIITASSDRSQSYTRRSVAQRYVSGAKNAYFKQTWMTPKYAMWSQVEAEVSLNDDGSIKVNTYDTRYIQDGYQGERWGIAWDDPPSGDSVITIKSPTTYRGTTSGISIYEDTLQHEDTLIAVYNIPEPTGQTGNDGTYPNQYVKGSIPNGYLAYIDESEASGRLFLHYNNVLVSIYLTDQFPNYSGSPGFQYNCSKLGLVVETASPTEFPQATAAQRLAAFRTQILATTTDKSGINDAAPRLTYTNRKGKTLSLTYGQAGSINGDPVDYLQWPTLGNPWMHQPPQGNLTLFGPNRKLYYNFNDWTIITNNRPTAVAGSPVTANGTNPIDIDLSTRVSDTETPSNKLRYKVASGANGSVQLLADGRTARFIPAAGFSGTAGFTFTATDAGNDHRHVLHYDFEQANPTAGGSITDVTGNARHATVSQLGTGTTAGDASVPAAIANHSGKSLRLTNSSVGSAKFSRQLHQANVHLSNGDWTFATWFKRASYADDDFLLSIGNGDGFGGDGDELQLYCQSQNANVRLLHYNASNAQDLDLSTGGVLTEQWNHVAIRFKRTAHNTGTVTLFLNGTPVGSAANFTWALKQNSPVFFGGPAKATVLQRDFNGWLDDLVMFRGDLTDSEIRDLATSPVVLSGGLSLEQTIQVSTPPLAPAGLTAAPQGRDVVLSWINSGSGTTYTVQRGTSSGGPFTTLVSGLTGSSYTDITAVPGTQYFYQLIATSGAGNGPPSEVVSATLPSNDLSPWNSGTMTGWSRAARISFPGYTQAETLTNFPVLVAINSTTLPGFAYSQLAFSNGADLRFTDATSTTILNHEIDTWNPSGTSYVWVQVPALTPSTSIIAFWGNPTTQSAQPNTISGLSLWLKADAITSLADGATVNTWPDSSGNALTVTRDAGAPVFRTNVLNGQPVVRFTTDGGSSFNFPQLTDIRTVFWVVKENLANSTGHFLLGDDDKFHFHRGSAGEIWSTNTSANIRNGTTRLMGQAVTGTSTALGTGFRVVSVVTTGNVEASRLSRDRSIAGRSWDGDVAEVIIYNRALTQSEEAMVGNYLAGKYGLSVSYPGVQPSYATNGSTWSNGYLGVFHLRETSGQHLSSSPGIAPTRSVSATNQGSASGIVGSASSFNGSSNFVNLPDLGTVPQATVEAWVRLAGTPGSDGAGIVSSDTWSSSLIHFKALSNRAASVAAFNNGTVTSPADALPLGSYTHIAYSVAGSGDNALALYQNGSSVGTAKGHASNNLTNLNIAREFSNRYLNGTVDEVRVSNVARSAAWMQATHDTIRNPLTFIRAANVSTLTSGALATISTRPASAVGTTGATLNGNLSYTGGINTSVMLYWGTSDGGTNPAAWSNSIPLGTTAVGNFSAPLTGLTPATIYHFRAMASNANGNAWSPDSVSFTTLPGAPTGLALSSSNGQVTLQWNAVTGASHYTVKRSATSGGPWQVMLSNITGTSFIDSSTTPGSAWFYVVSASSNGGEGANSAEVSITPLAAPTGLSAIPGNGSVSLGWTATPGATGYAVKRSSTSGGPYTTVGTPTSNSFTNSPATNDTQWFYVVTSTAPGAESLPSNEASAIPVASLPAPIGLTATPGNTSVTLTWNPVPNARSYTVARSSTQGGPYSNVQSGLIAPTFTNTGLTNGITYYYVVRAVSSSTNSPNSAEVAVVPAPTPTVFTTASAGNWSSAVWSPSNPVAAFATTIVFNNSTGITSSQNLGGFLLNQLQLTGQGVTLAGDTLFFSGTSPAISGANNVAHAISNPFSIDALLTVNVPSNTLSLNGPITGNGSLRKTGAGTLALGATNFYLGDTTADGGTLRFNAPNPGLQNLIIGASAGSTTASTIELTAASATSTGLVVQNNSTNANTLTIGSGRSLTIEGDVSVGTFNAATTANTRLNASGAGTLTVSEESGLFAIGTCNAGAGVVSTVDLSGLSNFELQYPSEGGQLVIGNGSSGSTQASTFILAANNLIEVDSIQIANNQVSGATQTLRLGSGTNVIRVESISIGTTTSPSGGGRGVGSFRFNGSTGSLVLRDPSGSAGANLFIADNGGNGNGFGTFDVTGHHADIKLNSLRMGASSNGTVRTDTFSFDQGLLDIISLDVGLAQNTTNTRTSQINLGGGTVTLGNGNLENPGLISLARNATGVLNLTGGTVSAYMDITESVGTGSATLNLNGATLDLRGNSLVDITTLTLQSGTLRNVAQINGGAAITKTGSGTLTLDGTNTFTSPITISTGTFNLASTHNLTGAISGSGNLTVSGTLTGNGSVSAPTTVTGTLAPRGGNLAFSGALTFGAGGSVSSALSSNSAAAGSIGQVNAAGNLTTAGSVKVVLDGPASAVNLTNTFWNTTQSWPILTAANLSATFALGTVSNDPAGRVAAAYGNFTLQQNASTLTLVWTPLTDLEKWRYANFGNSANTGNGADNADPDNDGVKNIDEYTAGTNPNDPASLPSFIWTSTTSGDWSDGTRWTPNTAPASNAATKLEFLTGNTTLPAGPIIATNNNAGTFLLNSLRLAGTGSGTIAVNLAGGPLEFRASGTTAPEIRLAAFPSGVTYTIANDITLAADTTFNASNSGRFIFTGAISGPGALTRIDRWSNLILAGNNTYQGTTTIPANGSIQIGNDGTTGTPGTGPIVNNGTLRIDRSGTLDLPNNISGSGALLIDNMAAGDTVILGGDNSFAGNITINKGTLRLTRSSAPGSGAKNIFLQASDRRLQLSGGITLASNLTLTASTNSFDGGGISNLDGDNRIDGPIQISTGNSLLNISSTAGALTIAGNITATTTDRSLILGGASTAANTISGAISNGSTTAMPVTKQGGGVWVLTNTHSYTGATIINGGKLVLAGSLTSDISAATGTFAVQGSASSTGSLAINATGRFEAATNSSMSVGGSVTLAGNLDLIAPPGLATGSSFTLISKTSAGAVSGTFAGLSEGSTFTASGYDWQITYAGGDGNDVVVTIPNLSAIENWRDTHFGTIENTGDAADDADPNHDGESNLLEFSTGQNPHAASRAVTTLSPAGANFEFTYTRSKAAVGDGFIFIIEHSDTLVEPWTSVGSGSKASETDTLETMRASIPAGTGNRRFVRLKVANP
jgi:autotransporter-associated beta strand protein